MRGVLDASQSNGHTVLEREGERERDEGITGSVITEVSYNCCDCVNILMKQIVLMYTYMNNLQRIFKVT